MYQRNMRRLGREPRQSSYFKSSGTVPPDTHQLRHHLLVQPDVHLGGAVERAGVAELLGELLAGVEAGVEVEELHQVDDRLLPVVVRAAALVGLLLDHRLDLLAGHRRRLAGTGHGAGGGGGSGGRRARDRGTRRFRGAEDRVHNAAENAHRGVTPR